MVLIHYNSITGPAQCIKMIQRETHKEWPSRNPKRLNSILLNWWIKLGSESSLYSHSVAWAFSSHAKNHQTKSYIQSPQYSRSKYIISLNVATTFLRIKLSISRLSLLLGTRFLGSNPRESNLQRIFSDLTQK